MDVSLIVPALFFAAISLVLISYLLRLFLGSFSGDPRHWFENQRFKRKEKLFRLANEQYRNNLLDEACRNWQNSFYIESTPSNASLVETIVNHNLNILGKIVSLTEKKGGRLENLPLVEGLITSRAELGKSFIEVKNSVSRLKNKKSGKSGTPPEWAMAEFTKKQEEIKGKLDANRTALAAELERLFESLKKIPAAGEITYH